MGKTLEMRGHWFCDHCDDVVFMTYERKTSGPVPCPNCGRLEARFVPQALNRAVIAQEWFEAMRRAVDNATQPELYVQTNHRELR